MYAPILPNASEALAPLVYRSPLHDAASKATAARADTLDPFQSLSDLPLSSAHGLMGRGMTPA